MPGDVPVPVSATVCGLPVALSVTESVPLAFPAVVGAKLTLIVQELPAATLEPQVFVSEKPALVVIPEMLSAAVPLLLSVRGWDELVMPTGWFPKLKLLAEKLAAGLGVFFTPLLSDEPPPQE